MIIAYYGHRLPATHDLAALRGWLKDRGGVWDTEPDLYFKAFLLREAGRFGAIANNFASLYLWQRNEAFTNWLLRGGYKVVTDVIGRAEIETYPVLDAFRGDGGDARSLCREDVAIPIDADLTEAFASECALARATAARPDVVSSIVGLDPRAWKFLRFVLSNTKPDARAPGVSYEIAHLSRPLLATLPKAG